MPQLLNGTPEATQLGVSGQSVQDLNPDFSNQLFMNIQRSQAALRKRNQQQVMDSTGRFGQTGSGMQQQLLTQGNQGISDSAVEAAGGAAAEGVKSNQQNRQFNAGLAMQGQQGDLNRKLQQNLMEQQMGQQNEMFNTERQDSRSNQLMNLFGSGGIAALKYGYL